MKLLQCTRCKIEYPESLEYFNINNKKKNGFDSWCKECRRIISKKNRQTARNDPSKNEIIKQQKKKYSKSEKGQLYKRKESKINNHKRRIRKLNLPNLWNEELWIKCQEYWNYRCAYCGIYSENLEQEHFIPISAINCPGNISGNIVPSCGNCNLSKGCKSPFEWCKDKIILEEILNYFNCINSVIDYNNIKYAKRTHNRKPVLQINKDTNEIIKEFESIKQAERELNINNIGVICRNHGRLKTSGGYKWRFK